MKIGGAVIAVLVAVCSGSCSGGATTTCVTGASVQCTCANGMTGARVCGVQGAYGNCVCDSIANVEPVASEPAVDFGCPTVADHAAALMAADMGLSPEDMAVGMLELCLDDAWSEPLRQCVMTAEVVEDLQRCEQYTPSAGKDDGAPDEPHEMVMRIYQGARAYYMDPPVAGQHVFPEPSAGPTPPLGTCCNAGGRCSPDIAQWVKDPWIPLMFSVDDPSYYSYEYQVDNQRHEYYARAYGDLDCDGTYSTFEYRGYIDQVYADGPPGSPKLRVVNPDE